LLLFTLVIADGRSRRSAYSAVCCQAQWHCVAIGWSRGWGQRNGGWLAG